MNYIDIFQNQFKLIIPEIFFINTILIILIYGVLYNASIYYKYPILTYSIGWLSIQSLLITLFLLINGLNINWFNIIIFNQVLIIDDFTLFIKIIVIIITIITILISFNYILNQKISARINEYFILILFSTLSMLLIISSFDLISMYLAIELQSLSFYVLAAFQRNNEFSIEAGLKYFILGALSSGLLLFGESLIYGFTGLTNFEELTKLITITSNNLIINEFISITNLPFITIWLFFLNLTYIKIIILGLFFIIIAFLFKISAVPFHLWTPDVYEGAPTSITAFFSIVPKIAIIALLLRLCMYTFYDLINNWQYLIIFSAFLSMFIGTLGAIKQNKLKRLLAYSSIAHIGYLLIGLATGTIESIEALLIYIILYTIGSIAIFNIMLIMCYENFNINKFLNIINFKSSINNTNLDIFTSKNIQIINPIKQKEILNLNNLCFSSSKIWISQKFLNNIQYINLIQSNPILNIYLFTKQNIFLNNINIKEKKNIYIKHLTDLNSISYTNPILALTITFIFFSNAGIPPLAGFYGKLNIFLTAIENKMYFLALIGILCSVIGTFYSIRIIKIIYYHSMLNNIWYFYQPINKLNAIILALTLFFILFFFLSPSFLFIITHTAILSLRIQFFFLFFFRFFNSCDASFLLIYIYI